MSNFICPTCGLACHLAEALRKIGDKFDLRGESYD